MWRRKRSPRIARMSPTNYDCSTAATEVALALGGADRACRCRWYFSTRSALRAATADRIVVNSHTGLAISGFDPVAYFTDGKPKFGRPDMELSLDGAVWRFRNEGNRAAFADHPEVYTPRFGGYDPVAIARGASVPGHPLFWAVIGERLYLFYSDAGARGLRRRPGPHHRSRRAQMARGRAHHRALSRLSAIMLLTDAALAGSPQAMKAGHPKFFRHAAVMAAAAVRVGHDAAGGDQHAHVRPPHPIRRWWRAADRHRPRLPRCDRT